MTRIFSCLLDGSLVWSENDIKSDGNPIIFLGNAMEIPWLDLSQNPCHVSAWETSKTWINDMESSWNFMSILTKLPSICYMKWRGISVRIHVIFFTGLWSDTHFALFSFQFFYFPNPNSKFFAFLSWISFQNDQNSSDFRFHTILWFLGQEFLKKGNKSVI